ncbi:MAG: hypothetical protein ABJF50_13620 [Paracoccaceae bacterium]
MSGTNHRHGIALPKMQKDLQTQILSTYSLLDWPAYFHGTLRIETPPVNRLLITISKQCPLFLPPAKKKAAPIGARPVNREENQRKTL